MQFKMINLLRVLKPLLGLGSVCWTKKCKRRCYYNYHKQGCKKENYASVNFGQRDL